MAVDLPTNVDDTHINSSGNYAQPLETVPTDMTCYILRTSISVIFRGVDDAATDSSYIREELPYDLVLTFDKRLYGLINDAPACFQMCPRAEHKANLQTPASTASSRIPLIISITLTLHAEHAILNTHVAGCMSADSSKCY
ncbi:hypothetical protein EYZ11_012977 [Aspergillus tanneri]|uniref:Uncharacterized protein n=1 Tax=Aspergillus tanneri TaxID=1220188 RepID=A0A4S3IYU8_9EURO|nr:hypothetical protein EYZ11_012977 [Aspergillus tanneri]